MQNLKLVFLAFKTNVCFRKTNVKSFNFKNKYYLYILEILRISYHHQWHYSPDRALASLPGFRDGLVVTMWGYQPHDQPVLTILIRPPETSGSKASRHLAVKQVNRG
jgi:hypothetical protein